MNGKNIPMGGEPIRFPVAMIENLHFDGTEKRDPWRGDGFGPDKEACIAAGLEMAPFELENEVLVLTIRSQGTRWDPAAMNHSLLDGPCRRITVDIDPTLERFSIKEGCESVLTQGRQLADEQPAEE